MNILLSGCNGKMGGVITRIVGGRSDMSVIAGYDADGQPKFGYPVLSSLDKCTVKPDVIIDFSNPDALEKIMLFAKKARIPAVIATTGLSSSHIRMMTDASADIPVFYSANMSLGINLLIDLAKKAAKMLEGAFDIEILEKHHSQKLDAPSGTALAIADALNEVLSEKCEYIYDRHSRRKKRGRNEIGINAIRGGTIVGEHSVIFAGCDEVIEINHSAMSRDIFALGALKAALFLMGKKPGLYNMSDLVNVNC